MPKISLSLPGEILNYVDSLGTNRSKAIVSILRHYQRQQREAELIKAYDAYAALCAEDDEEWWSDWQASSAIDLVGSPDHDG